MQYSKEFFDLQIRFAQTVVALIDIPIEKALLDYTNIYVRFALGRSFDQHNPMWRCYADGLSESVDVSDWTYRFYLARTDVTQTQSTVATVGCFSYAMQNAGCIRIHFENIEPTTVSPLSIDRLPARLAELRSLFDHVRHNQQESTHVVGTSWLYNILAYKRCIANSQDLVCSFPLQALAVQAPIEQFYGFYGV